MGTKSLAGTGLAEALFSSVQRRLLALLFGHPNRSFQSAEVIRLVLGGTGGVLRELRRLEEARALTVTRIGNQKHYQANRECPGFHELHALVVKMMGVPDSDERQPKRPGSSTRRAGKAVPGPEPIHGPSSGPLQERGSNEPSRPSPPLPAPRPVRNDSWKVW